MYDYLYSNGDSFTMGMEIIGDKDLSEDNKKFAYPMKITDALRIKDNINSALPGAPNEWIARQTLADLCKMKSEGIDLKKVFVLIGWSSTNRLEISIRDQINSFKEVGAWPPIGFTDTEIMMSQTNFVNAHVSKWLEDKQGNKVYTFDHDAQAFCAQHLWDDVLEHEKWGANILAVKSFCEANDMKYLMHNNVNAWDSSLEDVKFNQVQDTIFNKNYYKHDTFAFARWALEHHRYGMREEGHFDETVHRMFSRVLLEYMEEENLI